MSMDMISPERGAAENAPKLSFKRVRAEDRQADHIRRPSSTYLKDAMYNLVRDKLGMVGILIVAFMVIFALLGPVLIPYEYDEVDFTKTFLSPGPEHIMGTDNLGRDVAIRIVYGARISLTVGFVASAISITIGVFYGAIAGYAGGRTDMLLMRFVEIISSIPSTLYVILLSQLFPDGGLTNIILVIGVTGWMGTARLVRGEVLSLKSREYVLAARVSCVSNTRIITRHLIPNAVSPIIVSLTLGIVNAIFTESSLRFLGIMSLGEPSWGLLASDGIKNMRGYPHLILFPALFISVTMLGFTLLSDALQKAFDPKKR